MTKINVIFLKTIHHDQSPPYPGKTIPWLSYLLTLHSTYYTDVLQSLQMSNVVFVQRISALPALITYQNLLISTVTYLMGRGVLNKSLQTWCICKLYCGYFLLLLCLYTILVCKVWTITWVSFSSEIEIKECQVQK